MLIPQGTQEQTSAVNEDQPADLEQLEPNGNVTKDDDEPPIPKVVLPPDVSKRLRDSDDLEFRRKRGS
jgi:hypothetical protein